MWKSFWNVGTGHHPTIPSKSGTMMTWEWWWWLWRWWPGSVPKAAISACPPMKDQHPYPRHPGHFHHYLHVFQANFLLYWISWQCNVIQSNGSMVQSLKSKAQVQGDRDSRCKFFHILSQKLLCLHKIANMRQTSKYGVEGHFGQYSQICNKHYWLNQKQGESNLCQLGNGASASP